MKEMKYKTVDGLTTAERSLKNAQDITDIENKIDSIGDVVKPESITFGDGSLVSTQATRAEDIISVEDVRLQEEIDKKVGNTEYNIGQAIQDNKISSIENDISTLNSDFTDLNDRVTQVETDVEFLEDEIEAQKLIDQALIAENIIQDGRLDAIELKDTQQDNRLDILEGEIVANVQDIAQMTLVPGIVSTTPDNAVFTVDKDFLNPSLNVITQETDATVVETLVDMNGLLSYEFTLQQVDVNSDVEVTIEAFDYATGTVIPNTTKTFIVNFSGSTEYDSKTIIIADTFPIGKYALRAYTTTGSVNFISGSCTIINQTTTGGSTEIYDTDVISTSNVGGTNTKEDINILDSKIKVNETDLSEKLDKVVIDETSGNQITFGKQSEDIYKIEAVDSTNTGVEIGFDIGNQVIVLQNLTNGEFSAYTPKYFNSAVNRQYVDDKFTENVFSEKGDGVKTMLTVSDSTLDIKAEIFNNHLSTGGDDVYDIGMRFTVPDVGGTDYFSLRYNKTQGTYSMVGLIDSSRIAEENELILKEIEELKTEIKLLKMKK